MTTTPLLTTINTADSLTGWLAGALNTDDFIQGTGSIGIRVTGATTPVLYNMGATTDLSNTHLYVWMNCTTPGILNTFANGGLRIRVTGPTTTNYGEWYVAGVDTYPGGWTCFVVDTAKAFTATGGTPPALTAIQHVGAVFSMAGTIMGNFSNCLVDAIRYGTGLKITGGTTGSPLTFDNIIADDNATANAYGIIRRRSGVIFLQGELQFGDTAAGDTIFQDSGEIIVFEDPSIRTSGGATTSGVSTSLYKITVQGSSGGDIRFELGSKTGAGDASLGTNGCIFSSPNVRYEINFTDADIDYLKLYGCQFSRGGLINFGTTSIALSGTNLELVDNTFNNCDQITRNISGSPLILHNLVLSNIATTGALQIADSLGGDGERIAMVQCDAFTSENDSVVQTITVRDHDFSSNTSSDKWIHVFAKKTWKLVNPIGTISTANQNTIFFAVNDANSVEELFQLDLTVQTAAGALIENAYTYVYEGLTNKDLPSVNRQATNVSGFATSDILSRIFTDNAGTSLTVSSRGNFALKVYKYGRSPFAGALSVDEKIVQSVTLSTDAAITELVQATAITNGSGITVTEHTTQPLNVINYDGGTVAFAEGDVVVGQTSGAQGTIREILGTTASGTMVLHTRNGSAFINDENLQVSGVTRAVAHTSGSGSFNQNYRWEVNCASLVLTTVYDYLAAQIAQATPNATFIDVIEWGEAEQTQLMYSGSTGYRTERNAALGQGVWLSKRGGGTVAYMTSNSGTQYIPPVEYTFTITGLQNDSEVRIYNVTDNSLISGIESSGSSFSYNYVYTGDVSIYVVVFHLSYRDIRLTGLTLSTSNQSIPVQQQTDRVYN